MSDKGLIIILSPLLFILVLSLISYLRKKPFLRRALLAVVFSSIALIFHLIRSRGAFPGGADIGYGLLMLFSPLYTWPLSYLGWYLGNRISERKCFAIGVTLILFYVTIPFLYIQSLVGPSN